MKDTEFGLVTMVKLEAVKSSSMMVSVGTKLVGITFVGQILPIIYFVIKV